MLNRLDIKQFTGFSQATFEFCPGLNIIIGDNGTGKTHVLKLSYLFCRAWSDLRGKQQPRLDRKRTEVYIEGRLEGLFRISDLGHLIRKGHKNGALLTAEVTGHIPTVQIHMPGEEVGPGLPERMPWEMRLQRGKGQPVRIEAATIPDTAAGNAYVMPAIYIPSKEIVSMFKGLVGLFDKYKEFPLDETYKDLAAVMATLEPRMPSPLLAAVGLRIAELLGGELRLEDNDLVFMEKDGNKLDAHLMAEGHRKLAMLLYLLRYHVVVRGSSVFWDEPEANLNPSTLRLLAEALFVLAGQGVQVVVATHSLFLLREFEVLGSKDKTTQVSTRYFSLGMTRKGVTVSTADNTVDIDPLVLLEEDLAQSDRFMETVK